MYQKLSEVRLFYPFKIDHFINIAPYHCLYKLSEVRLFHPFKIDYFMNIAPILTPTPTPTHPDPVLTTTELT